MPTTRLPKILLIDDEPNRTLLLPLETDGLAEIHEAHPNDVELEDILDADLVLVDYGLDNWPERENLSQLSLRPPDGLALAALLRRHAHKDENASPVAFAIFTQQIDAVARPLPPETRPHALAALANLDWVFAKGNPGDAHTLNQIASLAQAVTRLPERWPTGEATGTSALDQLCKLLDVRGSEDLVMRLRQEVEECLPPIHELSQWSHGLAVLRWLLQRVLPFPCFLWSIEYLAARLRIEKNALETALASGKPLRDALAETEYTGILQSFAGPRWWRTRVEIWLWYELGAQSTNDDLVYERVCAAASEKLPRSSPPQRPVVCLNTAQQPIAEFARLEDAIRIRPDGWPAYADEAWTTLVLARAEPRLGALVVQEERSRLQK
jgi:hypothetical protein